MWYVNQLLCQTKEIRNKVVDILCDQTAIEIKPAPINFQGWYTAPMDQFLSTDDYYISYFDHCTI